MAAVAYGSLPFQQQIAFFRNKRNVLTESWLDLWESEHDNGFMVAGANRIELVADFRDAVRRAIEDGETLADFRTRFDSIVAKHGWDYNGGRNWRSRVIYETNLRQSYNAGRRDQQQRLKKARPWKQYRHSDAVEHPRPVHQSWDGKIWHIDDPIWDVIEPQNGWGCQCYTQTLNDRDLKRLGKTGPDEPLQLEWTEVLVGQRSPGGPRLVRTPVGIDPGFAYAPGASLNEWPTGRRGGPVTPGSMQRTLEQSAQDALRKSTRLPASAAAQLLREIFDVARAQDALQAGYEAFQASAIAAGQARSATYFAGLLDADLVQLLGARGITPGTAAITARDAQLLQSLSGGLAANQLTQVPAALRSAQAVLWDASTAELLFVDDARDDLLVVRVGVGGSTPEVRGVVRMAVDALSQPRYALLRGRLP